MFRQRKLAVVFGGSGFLGRYVVQRLARAGMVVRVAVRHTEGAMFLRPLGTVGQIVPLYAPVTEEALVRRAVEGADVAINLTGILAERHGGDFTRIHEQGAGRIARLAAAAGVSRLVQISGIGADADSPSQYARSKAAGEAAVRAADAGATILRPSIIFGAEDAFFNRFAAMAALSPAIPVVGGSTLFQPVYVGDVADAIMAALAPARAGQLFELGGPEVKSFHDLIAEMLVLIERRRLIIDLPIPLAKVQGAVLERMPGKLLTRDQVKQLGRDNVVAPDAPGLADLGIPPTPMGLILPSYLARYRPGGRRRAAAYSN